MMKLFRRDPRRKLQKLYETKLEKAMHKQRNGDIRSYSTLHAEAEAIYRQIRQLEDKGRAD